MQWRASELLLGPLLILLTDAKLGASGRLLANESKPTDWPCEWAAGGGRALVRAAHEGDKPLHLLLESRLLLILISFARAARFFLGFALEMMDCAPFSILLSSPPPPRRAIANPLAPSKLGGRRAPTNALF